MRSLKLAGLIAALVAVAFISRPAYAGSNNCSVSPSASGEVGTVFTISCWGFSPNTWTNVYAVEPDGRASGIDVYGFFPTLVKSDGAGYATLYFVTEFPGFFSAPVGHYTFVVQQLGLGNSIVVEDHVDIDVQSRPESYSGAYLSATQDGRSVSFSGWGFGPYENVNVWVTQPDGSKCSGLGIDQLSLAALGGGGSSLWIGPSTVKADTAGNIAFTIDFQSSACIGDYVVTVRSPSSGRAAEASFTINGDPVTATGGAYITVSPNQVPSYNSFFTVSGWGFPANTVVNCWFTRPDGRVLGFISQNPKTDAGGAFSTGAFLDDFPPYTSSEPGTWYATCATPNRSDLATTWFTVYALESDP